MEIESKVVDNVCVLKLTGEIDAYNVYKLKNFLNKYSEKGYYHFMLDLKEITFIDSTAFGTLIIENNYLREHTGSIKLFEISPKLKTTIRLMGLEDILDIYPDEAKAFESFQE